MLRKIGLVIALVVALGACESNPSKLDAGAPARAELTFVDLRGFDRELANSLGTPLPAVEVAFYDRIAPSAMPERLQNWMAAVEQGGGKVEVVPVKPTVTAKSPFMLISAVTALWSASKMASEVSTNAQFKAAQVFDAKIILKLDAKGESIVDKVVFVLRKP